MVGWFGISPAPPPLWLDGRVKSDSDEGCIVPKVEHSSSLSAEKKTQSASSTPWPLKKT